MSDHQPPPAPYAPPPAPYAPPPEPYAPPPAEPCPPSYQPHAPTPQVPKKRTGLIVTIVVAAVLLMCCCGAGIVAFLLFFADRGSPSAPSPAVERPAPGGTDPAEAKRLGEWRKVQDAFVKHDYEFIEPDTRQTRLMKAATSELLPDFDVEEFMVEPGRFDEESSTHYFDHYFVRVSLKSDPDIETAMSYEVSTPAAEESDMTREDLTLEEGDDAIRLEGGSWAVFPTGSKAPLLRGIKDEAYVGLMAQAIADFPNGLPTRLVDEGTGVATVHVETWDSFVWSYTYDHIEASYEREGEGWRLRDYKAVLEPRQDTVRA